MRRLQTHFMASWQHMFQEDIIRFTLYLRRYKKLGTKHYHIIGKALKLPFVLLLAYYYYYYDHKCIHFFLK